MRSRDRSRRCIDRDISRYFIECRGVWVADHLFVNNDVGPFCIVEGGGLGSGRIDGESRTIDDSIAELIKSDSLAWIGFKDAAKDGIEFGGKGKDGSEKVGIAEVGSICLVSWLCSLPWVASAGEIDEDDTK